MISQARISGILNEFLLAFGSTEEYPFSFIDRAGSIGGKHFIRTASGPHFAADYWQWDRVSRTHYSST
jgi:hypothetical protein